MSVFSNLFGREKAVVQDVEKDVQAEFAKAHAELDKVEAELKSKAEKVEPVVKSDIKAEQARLKGLFLQALNDEKARLKNAAPGLTAEAQSAVDSLIQAAVEALIKDTL